MVQYVRVVERRGFSAAAAGTELRYLSTLSYEQLLLGYRRSVVLLLGMRIVGRILVHKKDYSANQWLDAVGLTAHLAAFSVFDGDQSTKWIQTESALDE